MSTSYGSSSGGFNPKVIRTGRERHGWTRAQFARLCRLSPDTIERLENGAVAPRVATLKKIAEVLGCKVRDFYCAAAGIEAINHFINLL
jgi:transcriptional regulator with XRE-family HTH domain